MADIVRTNIDDIIKAVNIIETQSAGGNKYKAIEIQFENGEDMRLFPRDRSAITVIEQEIELTKLRVK